MPDEARQNPAVPARSPRYPRLHAWLQLVRLPNLFTVPGDPLVGYVLALWTLHGPEPTPISLGQALWVVLASVTLYAGGLISNDLFDLEEDRRDRPERPLPSGRVSVRSALVAAIVMFIGGIACAFAAGRSPGCLACALTLLILIYNGGGKRVPLWGPLNMGACRGFSLLIGATAAGPKMLKSPLLLVAAAGVSGYIASVSWLAAGETTGQGIGARKWLPSLISAVWIPAVITIAWPFAEATIMVGMAFAFPAVFLTARIAAVLGDKHSLAAVSTMIGRLVAALVLLQALEFWSVIRGELAIPLGFLFFAFYGFTRVLQKSFYAS